MRKIVNWLSAAALVLSAYSIAFALVTPNKTDFVDYCTGKNNSNCVFQIDANGNVTASGSISTQGALSATGNTTGTNTTLTGLANYPSTSFSIAGTSTIPATSSYEQVTTSATAVTITVTSLPSVSTATTVGGTTPLLDGTLLVLGSSGSATSTSFLLQDNGTLSGSRLHLGAAGRQVGPDKVLTLIYRAAETFWQELSYANNN